MIIRKTREGRDVWELEGERKTETARGSVLQVGRAGGMLAQAWSTRGDRAALLVTEEQRQQQVRGDVTATQEVLETGRPVPAGTGWIQSAGVGSGQRRRWTELGRVAQPSMAYCRWCTERDVRERGKLRLQSNLSLYVWYWLLDTKAYTNLCSCHYLFRKHLAV